MARHSVEKVPKAPPQTHWEIHRAYTDSTFCLKCDCRWMAPIAIESDDETSSSCTHTQSSSSQITPSIPKPNYRDRTANFQKHFRAEAQEALQASRGTSDKSLYNNTAGIPVRWTHLLSIGEYQGDFFILKENHKLGSYKLEIPLNKTNILQGSLIYRRLSGLMI